MKCIQCKVAKATVKEEHAPRFYCGASCQRAYYNIGGSVEEEEEVILISRDNQEFRVTMTVARRMGKTLSNLLEEDIQSGESIPMPNIHSSVLKKLVSIAKEDESVDSIEPELFIDVLLAANYLDSEIFNNYNVLSILIPRLIEKNSRQTIIMFQEYIVDAALCLNTGSHEKQIATLEAFMGIYDPDDKLDFEHPIVNAFEGIITSLKKYTDKRVTDILLYEAVKLKRINVLRLMLKNDSLYDQTKILSIQSLAASRGVEVFKILMGGPRFTIDLSQAFLSSVEAKGTELLSLLLSKYTVTAGLINRAFIRAINHQNLEAVELLVKYHGVDPSYFDNHAIVRAASFKDPKFVRFLLQYENVNPSVYDNKPIIEAAKNGNADVVRLLLPHADPTAQENLPIRIASIRGHADVVRVLLADGRANPAVNDNEPIKRASKSGLSAEVVRLLLSDDRVDPTAEENYAVRATAANGRNLEVLRLLLAIKRVNPAARDNEAIRMAAANDHPGAIKLLLADTRVDYSTIDLRRVPKNLRSLFKKYEDQNKRRRLGFQINPL
jgi:hypothetical protein